MNLPEFSPATPLGAVVRYLIIAIGPMLGVQSEDAVTAFAGYFAAFLAALIGMFKTRKAEQMAGDASGVLRR